MPPVVAGINEQNPLASKDIQALQSLPSSRNDLISKVARLHLQLVEKFIIGLEIADESRCHASIVICVKRISMLSAGRLKCIIQPIAMTIDHYICNLFAGLFLCNCIPHLTAGLRGEPFPSPFAKPPGRGNSSPLVNFIWGSLNLFLGVALIAFRPIPIGLNLNTALLILGFLAIGIHLSLHFGKVRKGK